jgi:hypothetical protein
MPIKKTKNKCLAHLRKSDVVVFGGKPYKVLKVETHLELPDHLSLVLGADVLAPQPDGSWAIEVEPLAPLALHQNDQVQVPDA